MKALIPINNHLLSFLLKNEVIKSINKLVNNESNVINNMLLNSKVLNTNK